MTANSGMSTAFNNTLYTIHNTRVNGHLIHPTTHPCISVWSVQCSIINYYCILWDLVRRHSSCATQSVWVQQWSFGLKWGCWWRTCKISETTLNFYSLLEKASPFNSHYFYMGKIREICDIFQLWEKFQFVSMSAVFNPEISFSSNMPFGFPQFVFLNLNLFIFWCF